jgi:hypothetical protein
MELFMVTGDAMNIDVSLGSGNDVMLVSTLVAQSLTVNGNDGDDMVTLVSSSNGFTNIPSLIINGGSGTNSLVANLGNCFLCFRLCTTAQVAWCQIC